MFTSHYSYDFHSYIKFPKNSSDYRRLSETVIMPSTATADTKVIVLGHSYVRRLKEFIESNSFSSYVGREKLSADPSHFNLRQVKVDWLVIGGLTIASLPDRNYQHFKLVNRKLEHIKPSVVVLQLGENDLDRSSRSAEQVKDDIETLVRALSATLGRKK